MRRSLVQDVESAAQAETEAVPGGQESRLTAIADGQREDGTDQQTIEHHRARIVLQPGYDHPPFGADKGGGYIYKDWLGSGCNQVMIILRLGLTTRVRRCTRPRTRLALCAAML